MAGLHQLWTSGWWGGSEDEEDQSLCAETSGAEDQRAGGKTEGAGGHTGPAER